jgi:hypothetical protein
MDELVHTLLLLALNIHPSPLAHAYMKTLCFRCRTGHDAATQACIREHT